jgi:hypothetical protein
VHTSIFAPLASRVLVATSQCGPARQPNPSPSSLSNIHHWKPLFSTRRSKQLPSPLRLRITILSLVPPQVTLSKSAHLYPSSNQLFKCDHNRRQHPVGIKNLPQDISADRRASARSRLLPLAVPDLPIALTQRVHCGLPGAMAMSNHYHNAPGPLYDPPHDWPLVDFRPNDLPGGVALGLSSFPVSSGGDTVMPDHPEVANSPNHLAARQSSDDPLTRELLDIVGATVRPGQ